MSSESELRKYRCCFTGHRPEKLHKWQLSIKMSLTQEIKQAIRDGYVTFISGMSRGVDLWAASIVLKLREKNKDIHLIAAVPFDGFEKYWDAKDQALYREVLEKADLVRFISKGYSPSVYQKRNEWMVNHSNRVIAVFNGESGGTRNTILYAESIPNIEIRMINV